MYRFEKNSKKSSRPWRRRWVSYYCTLRTAAILAFPTLFLVFMGSSTTTIYPEASPSLKNRNDYYRYYEMKSFQDLWNNSFIPFRAYPIEPDRWTTVSNTTCVHPPLSFSHPNHTAMMWQSHKIPHAIVIGTQKGGSSAMASFLAHHPDVARPSGEMHFLSRAMDAEMSSNFSGIDQVFWQQQYYDRIFEQLQSDRQRKRQRTRQDLSHANTNNNSHIKKNAPSTPPIPQYIVEKTPNYILLSDRVPQRLLCLCPWSKLILLLRNPIDRAFSQYNMQQLGYKRMKAAGMTIPPFQSFDEWIQQDYNVLVAFGVLQNDTVSKTSNNNNQNDSINSLQEDSNTPLQINNKRQGYQGTECERQGWSAYTKLAAIGDIGGLGRGLYSLQITQWREAYQRAGQPLDMLVLSSEFAKANPQEAFDRVCDHLGISRVQLVDDAFKNVNRRNYSNIPPLSTSTRQWLEQIFEPYNRQLFDLLDQKEEWRNVWKVKS